MAKPPDSMTAVWISAEVMGGGKVLGVFLGSICALLLNRQDVCCERRAIELIVKCDCKARQAIPPL